MNRLPDIFRLIFQPAYSDRQIAKEVGRSHETIRRYRRLVEQKSVEWSDIENMDGYELDALFNLRKHRRSPKVLPDWAAVEQRLSQRGATRSSVWSRYREQHAESGLALSYSQFCLLLSRRKASTDLKFIQKHPPGEAVQVDFSGEALYYQNPTTGDKVKAELFIGVLPASQLIFATCVATQSVPDWLLASNRMVAFFGGAPQVAICDNAKCAVVVPGPQATVQRHYRDWATHHAMAVWPTRPYSPRDKGAVENSVKFAQNRILEALDACTFFSVDDINAALDVEVEKLNDRPMQKSGESRRARFERMEREALQPLPEQPYVYAEWRSAVKVPPTYHVPVDKHHYSVPYTLVGEKVEARVLLDRVEIVRAGRMVATHARNSEPWGYTTDQAHLPDEHRAQAEATPDGLQSWAAACGPHTAAIVAKMLSGKIPLQGVPTVRSLRNLARSSTAERLETACGRALALRMPSLTGVRHQLRVMREEEEHALSNAPALTHRRSSSLNAHARRRAVQAESRRRMGASR